LEPPRPGEIDALRAKGTLQQSLDFAKRLGNYRLRAVLRGKRLPQRNAQDTAGAIMAHFGESLDAKGAQAVRSASAADLGWVELDLNHDRVVDERDVLALGFAQPKEAAAFPSLGTSKTFCLLLDFDDYPSYFPQAEFQQNLFSDGTDAYGYRSLHYYYDLSSYHQLNVDGMAYGWHRASHPRTYYHPDDSNDYPESWTRQAELVEEAILDYDAQDFSQYDNDGDGSVDYFLVVWTGPRGAWASFWWGYFGVGLPGNFTVDGVTFPAYSWQWERAYGFGGAPPAMEHWDPLVTIHETGHALGLPDYYDYDGSQGPGGGVGGLDMMDSTWGDHNCFSKYVLGWYAPTVAFTNLLDEPLERSDSYGDAVIAMPGFDPVTPWAEYFMAQNRFQGGLDYDYPASGMLLWHVDARVDNNGYVRYDNSYTSHKLLKLLEADGLNEIESGGGANAGDYYQTGNELSPASSPNSHRYDDSDSGVTVNDFSAPGDTMTADFILYTSNPPTVSIVSPNAGDTLSGSVPVHVTASDDVGVSSVQILIDGLLVNTNSSSTDFTYNWNTLVDFNKTLTLTARAWDADGQAGSMSIDITVSNAGVVQISDGFEASLSQWRSINEALDSRGQRTQWGRRASPADPPPLGSGREAFVRATVNGQWCTAHDKLRSMRLDASAYTRALQVKFACRCRAGFALWLTGDEGATWRRLDTIPESYDWAWFNRLYSLAPGAYYLRLDYDGDVKSDDSAALSANIDDVLIRESPSDPPTVQITAPADGATVADALTVTADAQDDSQVLKVYFYLQDGLAFTDEDGAPWEYSRNTLDDDNHPAIRIKAIAEDDDGLPSVPDEITVVFRNARPYPVVDDLEAGMGYWGIQGDGLQPEWQYVSDVSHSPSHAMGYVPAGGPWEQGNSDQLWFNGYPPPAGRQCIDLSAPGVHNPELTFWYMADQPGDGGIAVLFYNTWIGYQDVAWLAGDQPGWAEQVVPLTQFTGQSGQIVWWVFGGSEIDGTGMWIDDVRVGNHAPVIDSITPGAAFAGTPVTLSGRRFGASQGTSKVTFSSGVDPPPGAYLSWSDTQIKLRVPLGAASGPVVAVVDGEQSDGVNLDVGALSVDLLGIDTAVIYTLHRLPALQVNASASTQRVELWIDGALYDASTAPPFGGLALPVRRLRNGAHTAQAVAYRSIETAQSPPRPFSVYSLRGDVDADGMVGLSDVTVLDGLIGLRSSDPGFLPWFDPDGDGVVTEADVSYIGYHFGESIQ
jgi:M6 family metalloprotease-like protein